MWPHGRYMLVTLLWAPALDTHGMVALVGHTGELPLAEWLGIMDLVLGEIDLATVRLATGYCWCTGRLLEYDVVQALATAIARWMGDAHLQTTLRCWLWPYPM